MTSSTSGLTAVTTVSRVLREVRSLRRDDQLGRLTGRVRLGEGGVEAGAEVGFDRLLVFEADVAPGDQLLRVDRPHRLVRVDELVHARLGERGLVGFVVAVAAVADEVDHDVLVERAPELEREVHHPHRGFGVVAVHVEDRRLHHLGDVGGVHARTTEVGRGREPELVVHDDVHGAADLVAGYLGEVERLGDDALARERGIAVHEHGQHGVPAVVVPARRRWRATCLRRPGPLPRDGWGWRRA